jgi:hypothetical protein
VVRRVEDGMDGRLGVMRTGGESFGGDGKGMLRKVEAGEVGLTGCVEGGTLRFG